MLSPQQTVLLGVHNAFRPASATTSCNASERISKKSFLHTNLQMLISLIVTYTCTFAYQYCTIYTNLTNLIWIGRHIYFIVSNIFTLMCIIAFLKLAVYLLCRGVMKTRRAQRWKTMKLASVSPSSAESQDGFF